MFSTLCPATPTKNEQLSAIRSFRIHLSLAHFMFLSTTKRKEAYLEEQQDLHFLDFFLALLSLNAFVLMVLDA